MKTDGSLSFVVMSSNQPLFQQSPRPRFICVTEINTSNEEILDKTLEYKIPSILIVDRSFCLKTVYIIRYKKVIHPKYLMYPNNVNIRNVLVFRNMYTMHQTKASVCLQCRDSVPLMTVVMISSKCTDISQKAIGITISLVVEIIPEEKMVETSEKMVG